MRPTTTNLLLFAAVALVFAGIGASVFRLSTDVRSPARMLLRLGARFLMILGFLMMGNLLWGHVSGQFGSRQVWFRAPTFYLSSMFLFGAALWWFTKRSARNVFSLTGYPLLVIALVTGWQSLVQQLQHSKSKALHI